MEGLVSVIITTYGDPKKLHRAIKSVIAQTYTNIEIIIIDDNDSGTNYREHTEAVMANYNGISNIIYIKHLKNLNGAYARNSGIMAARGEYIAFLDNDDFYLPERVQKSVAILVETGCDAAFTDVLLVDSEITYGIALAQSKSNFQKELLSNSGLLGTGSNLFFTKRAVCGTGCFDTDFVRYQDVEYMLRFFDKYEGCNIHEVLTVKDTDGRNFPKYEKLAAADKLFIEKFTYLIDGFNKNERWAFMNEHYALLLNAAIWDNNDINLKEAIVNICLIRKLTKKEFLRIKFHSVILIRRYAIKRLKAIALINKYLLIVKKYKLRKVTEKIMYKLGKSKSIIIMTYIKDIN